MTIYRADTLRRADADAIYSAQGHGHADLAQDIADGVTAQQSHEATKVHVDRFEIDVPLTFIDTELVDGLVVPFRIPLSGYIDALYAYCDDAPTGSAASFAVAAGAWGGTPSAVGTVTIGTSAFSGSQTTIAASEVTKNTKGAITITADSGGTCKNAYVVISINPGDVVPTDPIVEGRLMPVTWFFPDEEEGTIDRFEILRDGNKVWETTNVAARSAQLFFYWDSVYSLRACLSTTCSEVAPQLVAVFAPALAYGKPVVASSENALYPASNTTDGRASTYWRSLVGQTQSLKVDLGAVYTITDYRLKLGTTSRAMDWVAQASVDDTNWVDLETVVDNPDQVVIKSGFSDQGRWVRWNFTQSASTTYLVSELEVTGS